jgi:UDP-glucose 4-epimerase
MSVPLTLITGAGGFIGTALCAHLRERGRPIVAAVRAMHASMPNDVEPVGDLMHADDAALDALVDGVDAVVHLAGRAHVMKESAHDPEGEYRRANAELTQRLAQASVRTGVRRFVLASTIKVNGERTRAGTPFRPDDAPAPGDAYAASKLAAEEALVDAVRGSSTAALILRLPLVYGRGARGNFPRLVDAVVHGRGLPLASIRNRRSLLYVGNLVEAIGTALDLDRAPAGVHLVADAEAVSTPDLVRAIATAWHVRPRLFAMPVPLLKLAGALAGRSAVVSRLADSLEADTSSFRIATAWTPHWSLDAALARTASTHRNAPPY